MRTIISTVSLLVALALPLQSSTLQHPAAAHQAGVNPHAMNARYDDLPWQVMVPEIGCRLTAGRDSARRSQDTGNPAADSHSEADARPHALAQRERDPHGDQRHVRIRARRPETRARTRRLQLPSRPHPPPGLGLGRCAGVHHGRCRVGRQLGERPANQERPREMAINQPLTRRVALHAASGLLHSGRD